MSTKHILFADDNVELQELVKMFLEKRGFRVSVAGDGWNCLRIVKEERPDLLLLDIQMPKMDGIRTIEMMVGFDLMKDLPIILITGSAEKEIVLKAAHLGVVDYLKKPFETKELLNRIEKHLVQVDAAFLKTLLGKTAPVTAGDARFRDVAELSEGKWDAHAANVQGREFCVLLPKGMTEKGAKHITADNASGVARVYLKRGIAWRRVWPKDDTSQAA